MTFPETVEKLDDIFSKRIRLRDADMLGNVRCISCGAVFNWKYIDNGHFIPRSNMSTRFHEKNNNGQCQNCNRYKDGNNDGYIKGLEIKYGSGIVEELESLGRQTKIYTKSELEELITQNREEFNKLYKLKA